MEGKTLKGKRPPAPVFRLAGLTAAISGAPVMKSMGRAYRARGVSNPDIAFDVSGLARRLQEMNPHSSWETCCYVASARQFYVHLLSFEGFALHASAVVMDGGAFLFSADSGTGKSTHASLWLSHFGMDRAYVLNDDKPLIRKVEGRYLAYGAPWCGSSGLHKNESAPVKGVAFLARDKADWIRPLSSREALPELLRQSDPLVKKEAAGSLLTLLDDFLQHVPVYLMGCTISENAVCIAHGAMAGNGRTDGCTLMA